MSRNFDVVVLADRLPYPPVGGDRLRVYHVCRFLADQGARLHLLAFGRSEEEARRASDFPGRDLFSTLRLVPLNKTLAAARVFLSLFTRESMQLRYHHSSAMRSELARLMKDVPVRAIICHLIRMAEYAKPYPKVRRVLEMIDVFSDYYAKAKRVVGRKGLLVYSVEEPRIRKAEKEAIRHFDHVVLVAPREREILEHSYPEAASKFHVLPNGAPEDAPDPGPIDPDRLVFHGTLSYPPNRDAALRFAREIFPELRREIPALKFQILGAEPGPELKAIASKPGIVLTGPVDRIAPHVASALASVCPLRSSAGLQNKVLEAMAWGTPVIGTAAANAGVQAVPGESILIAETIDDWKRHVASLRSDPGLRRRLANSARRFVRERFSWSTSLKPYPGLLGM